MRSVKRALLGCLLLVLAVAVGMCSRPYIRDNRLLGRARAEYSHVTHPASSLALASFSQLGIAAGGNGNHCDYLVGEIRESEHAPENVKTHYSAFHFPMLDPQNSQWASGEDVLITVEFPGISEDSGILRYDIPELVKKARAQQRKKTLYVVYLLDGGYEPNGDWRCH
jgi:hypothetical protein